MAGEAELDRHAQDLLNMLSQGMQGGVKKPGGFLEWKKMHERKWIGKEWVKRKGRTRNK